jgi:hypothetical protein
MITGDVAAAADTGADQDQHHDDRFRMMRAMRLPSCEQMRRRFASRVPSGTH